MKHFCPIEIGRTTEKFILRNKSFNYELHRIETQEDSVLLSAENLFSSIYCHVTNNIELVKSWAKFQRDLYKHKKPKRNQYLVYIIPEEIVKDNSLHEELSIAESNEYYFRKIFIDIPENYTSKIIEKALACRLPMWMSDKEEVLREYIPIIEDIIPDQSLRTLLTSEGMTDVVEKIETEQEYGWLFSKENEEDKKSQQFMSPEQKELLCETSKINTLELINFRCFSNIKIDLNSNVTIVYGKNGRGKTSIVDAIEFSIFNSVQHLEYDPDIKNIKKDRYSTLINNKAIDRRSKINLTGISKGKLFNIETNIHDNSCESYLNERIACSHDIISFLTGNEKLSEKKEYIDILLHTHFLGQHSIRHFIHGVNSKDENETRTNRHDLISEMFGFGKIDELMSQLRSVCRNITQTKVNKYNKLIAELDSNLRSLRRKYGPRKKADIEDKGYKIDYDHAVQKYKEIIGVLENGINIALDKSMINYSASINDYLKYCDILTRMLNNQIKERQNKQHEFNRINLVYLKVKTILGDLGIHVNASSFLDYIGNVRDAVKEETEKAEKFKQEAIKTGIQIQDMEEAQDVLKTFKANYKEYENLVLKGKDLKKTLLEIEKENKKLHDQKEVLEERLFLSKDKESDLSKQINILKKKLDDYKLIKIKQKEISTKKIQLRKSKEILESHETVIMQYQSEVNTLSLLNNAEIDDQGMSENIIQKTNLFYFNNNFICPCCGFKYNDKKELDKKIINQISEGQYKKELEDFIFSVYRLHKNLAAKEIVSLIQLKSKEKERLEKEIQIIESDIFDYEKMVKKVFKKKNFEDKDLQLAINEFQSRLANMESEINKIDIDTINDEIEKINEDILAKNYDFYEGKYNNVKNTILGMEEGIISLLSPDEITIININKKLCEVEKALKNYKEKLLELNSYINGKIALKQNANDVEKYLIEIESLIAKYHLSDHYSDGHGLAPSTIDTSTMEYYYQILSQLKDLSNLFGLINIKDETEIITNSIEKFRVEKDKWTNCRDKLRKINKELALMSHMGLEKSIKQYGPLINEIYKKFIRHEYFNEVHFESVMSPQRKNRNLYIFLKNYSGKTNYTPSSYLSEAQLNILALSIFLTRVIYQNISIFQTILIDDPIQQMDEMNTMSFIDIILGLSQTGKQIIITTCDYDFFELFSQKMSGLSSAGDKKFRAINLEEYL